MARRFFTAAALLSLLLCVPSAILWGISHPSGTVMNPLKPSTDPLMVHLNRPLPGVRFTGAALVDVFDFLRDVSGWRIEVDWPAIEAAGVDRNTKVTLAADGVRFGEALALLLEFHGLAFATRGPAVFVTTRAALDAGPPPPTPPATAPPERRRWETVRGSTRRSVIADHGVISVWQTPADPAAAFQPASAAKARKARSNPSVSEFLGVGVFRYGYPYEHRRVDVPFWLIVSVTALLPLLWLVAAVRRARRKAPGHCPTCGYDLRATPGRCPECGVQPAAAPAAAPAVPALLLLALAATPGPARAAPDLIVHNGRIVTADPQFSVADAMAIESGKVIAVGASHDLLRTKGPSTTLLDLRGRTVLPGLIDSHVHPSAAAMIEFDHPVPAMESIPDVLAYVTGRANALGPGKWVEVKQVFITRLREQRYPTRDELDAAAPNNPVLFSTGPDASLNSLALRESGIDRSFKVADGGPGYAEKDPATGEPTGILRGCTRYVKTQPTGRQPTEEDRYRRTLELFRDYNAAGLTTVADRAADSDAIARYSKMRDAGDLTVRLTLSQHVATLGAVDDVRKQLRAIAESPLRRDDPLLRLVGVKTFLDGGMLTGSAYMLEPWGVSPIYSITDPQYRGVLLLPKDRLLPIARAAAEAGLQFTAHSVGDGAVRTLLDAYAQIAGALPAGALRATRPCVTHCNFVHPDDVPRFARLGVVADIQPVWLYADARTLSAHFGEERLSRFQPLRDLFAAGAVVGGGSDHMQKIGARRAINPYDPFLGMATAVTRTARWHEGPLHPGQALTRQQAVRMYTSNNAFLLFREHQVGSLEPGKFADFIVVDTDVLTCPPEQISQTKVLRTYLAGKSVYEAAPN